MSDAHLQGTKKPKLSYVASGGLGRVTKWIVLCPEHPELADVHLPSKVKARESQRDHVYEFHKDGGVLIG